MTEEKTVKSERCSRVTGATAMGPKAGFTLRTQIYGAYADHFAHLGRVFSATNDDLRCRDRSGAECKHSYNTPSFTRGCWIVNG